MEWLTCREPIKTSRAKGAAHLLIAPGDVDLGHTHYLPKHMSREWKDKILFDQCEEPASLLRFGVGIRVRLLDEFIQVFRGEPRRRFRFRFHHREDLFQRPASARRRTKARQRYSHSIVNKP